MSKPIDLYRMVIGGKAWTFTSSDVAQIYNAGSGNEKYQPLPIGRGEIEQKNEITKANVDIKIPIGHALAVQLLSAYSEQVMTVSVFRNTNGTVETAWKGRLASLKPGESDLTLSFESIFTSLRRPGLRARYQKSCRHALYGRGCLLNPADFATAGTLSVIAGQILTVAEAASKPDGYFAGGMVKAPDGTLSFIVSHTGTSIKVQRVSYALANAFALAGGGTIAVTLYAGCDHTRATCWSKFSNGLRYGGFDWIPTKNPMGGTSIV